MGRSKELKSAYLAPVCGLEILGSNQSVNQKRNGRTFPQFAENEREITANLDVFIRRCFVGFNETFDESRSVYSGGIRLHNVRKLKGSLPSLSLSSRSDIAQ